MANKLAIMRDPSGLLSKRRDGSSLFLIKNQRFFIRNLFFTSVTNGHWGV
ncbi:uncharacterized protein G2W53_028466 [Senna tora]|uniref:Uncharacterized protein n=1 Tax=Senna tora TaxID=362788 RepID=A0A834T3L0_9FABA|nr:uncharacterized protein G2W53_028466 [Senna tora]